MNTQIYTLINSTNRYLDEYTPLCENSRYYLTGFSGSTGDALICPDGRILLFVDGRYHQQADLETVGKNVTVIKLKTGEPQLNVLCSQIKKNSILKINPEKTSQYRYEFLKKSLTRKNIKIQFTDDDNFAMSANRSDRHIETLAENEFDAKIEKLKPNMLVTNSEEISYLCGIRCFDTNYTAKVEGKFLILNGKYILFTDYGLKTNIDERIITLPECDFKETVSRIPEEIIVDKSSITALDYSYIIRPKHKPSKIKQIKSKKTKTEIEHYKYAFKNTDKTLLGIRAYIEGNDNLSEYDITKKLHELFLDNNAKSLSFKSIVAINKNSALAHYSNSSKEIILREGDLVLIDCGAYYSEGLATDITRVFVKGTPNELQKRVYTTVLKTFLNCFNTKIKNTTGYDIDDKSRKIIRKNKIKDFKFSHGLGHGIGIGVHEIPPNLSKNKIAKTVLRNNMCFTIEPGLYNYSQFGIRLENSCYLEKNKIKSFTNMCFEKKLILYSLLTEQEKEWLERFEVL